MKISVLISTFVLFTSAIMAQPAGWQVNSSDYENSMTLTAIVEFDEDILGAENDFLAAFVGGECRGVVQASFVEDYQSYMFFLTIFSNEYEGEEITFNYYQQSTDSIYEGFLSLQFNSENNLGNASSPYVVSNQMAEMELSANAVALFYSESEQQLTQSIQVTNTGGGLLNYTTEMKSGAWASITTVPVQLLTQESADITVTADIQSLDDGVYIDTLVITSTEDVLIPVELDINTVGINNTVSAEISMYPNPANRFVIICSPYPMQKMEIFSLDGKLIINQKQSGETKQKIDLNSFAKGIYIVKLGTNKGVITKKLTIE